MRVAIVINSRSGSALDHADPATVAEAALRGAGVETIPIPPGPSLEARLQAAIDAGPDAVVVGGGDGTICAAAARLAETGIPLGILPMGTMNLLAQDLGVPQDIKAAAAMLARAETRHIDVAEVNGHVFLNACMIGLPTHLGRHRERARGSGLAARWRFMVAAVRGMVQYPPIRLLVVAGDKRRRVWTRALAVSCNPLDEAASRFPARQTLDGGTLCLYVAQDFGVWWVVRFVLRALFRRWGGHPDLDRTTAPRINVVTARPRLRVMNDGEAMLLETPLRFRIRPGALAVLVAPHEPAQA
jgi:diacylglycerol kinase family enzyme